MTLNPYETASAVSDDCDSLDEHRFDVRRLIHRPTFVIVWIFSWTLLGTGFFFFIHFIDPIPPIDFTFYFRLHASIGAVSGLLSWYTARLVALNRISVGALSIALLLPYGFVTFLALVANPVIAILATMIFGVAFGLAYLVRPNGS
jgi:hypothetical protein